MTTTSLYGPPMGADSAGGGIAGGSVDRWGYSREGMQRHAGEPLRLQAADTLHGEICRYVDFVKGSRTVTLMEKS